MDAIRFIPFFYFQQTRINTLKSFGFHFTYEWMPAIGICLIDQHFELRSLLQLLLYYIAFISIYEIGYLMNDQQAYHTNDRKRSIKLSVWVFTCAILIRVAVFLIVTFVMENYTNVLWWQWYSILILVFGIHNFLRSAELKCITFSQLAFFRFLTPLFFIIDLTTSELLFAPVILNYVLFRLLIYMDSKSLISFTRETNSFRVGFYLVLMALSVLLSGATSSLIPVLLNSYYLSVVLLFAGVSSLGLKLK